ncbi:uncharacterized protein LOC116412635 [Galleria mellonella]|uniref:Uncharacterized protein LOC116412635 n=1 Tax=Galleria mellonella TaxID=7137 RepID=A0ABM3MBI2_GALME|nr:uncharacterized protein LOC116412635 [Galleria mellonella]
METGKRSPVWNYFEELRYKSVRCKLCGTVMKKNMIRHLRIKHPSSFDEMEATRKATTFAGVIKEQNKQSERRCWTKKYCRRAGDMMFACVICGVVLRMPDGLFSNMKRHIKSKHPDVYKSESEIAKKTLLESLTKECY